VPPSPAVAREVDVLLVLQDAATVQLLLELCLPRADAPMAEGTPGEARGSARPPALPRANGRSPASWRPPARWRAGEWEETVSIVCEALHQLFVENRALLTLVHEQGYDLRLLPLTVQGIPSMRTCSG